jgi:hypothetical protein
VLLATQNQLDSDNFAGSIGTTLHTHDANWDNASYSADFPDLILNGSGAAKTNGTFSFSGRVGQTWTNDQYVQATFTGSAPDNIAGIYVHCTSSGGHFSSGVAVITNGSSNNHWFLSYSGGLIDSGQAFVSGDVVNFQIVSNVTYVTINSIHIATFDRTEMTATTGTPGIADGDSTIVISNWTAGSVTGGGNQSRSLLGVGK